MCKGVSVVLWVMLVVLHTRWKGLAGGLVGWMVGWLAMVVAVVVVVVGSSGGSSSRWLRW